MKERIALFVKQKDIYSVKHVTVLEILGTVLFVMEPPFWNAAIALEKG